MSYKVDPSLPFLNYSRKDNLEFVVKEFSFQYSAQNLELNLILKFCVKRELRIKYSFDLTLSNLRSSNTNSRVNSGKTLKIADCKMTLA